jgi:hypothetical protein
MYPFIHYKKNETCLSNQNLQEETCKADFTKQDFTMASIGEPYKFYLMSLDEKKCVTNDNTVVPIINGACKIFNVEEIQQLQGIKSNLFDIQKKFNYPTYQGKKFTEI